MVFSKIQSIHKFPPLLSGTVEQLESGAFALTRNQSWNSCIRCSSIRTGKQNYPSKNGENVKAKSRQIYLAVS